MKKLIAAILINAALVLGEPALSQTFEQKLSKTIDNIDTKGIPKEYLITIAVLETSHGRSKIYHRTNNLFSYTVDINTVRTLHNNHKFYKVYRDSTQSVMEIVRLFSSRKRYHKVYQAAILHNDGKFFLELGKSGYAEDPNYADKLQRVYKELYR